MESQLNYTLDQKIKIKEHTLSRIPSSLEKFGQYISSSTREISSNQRSLVFKIIAELEGEDANVDIEFILDTDYIYEMRLSLYEKPRGINRYTLKYFALSLIQDVIASDHNGELKKYTVRTYSRYYCCYAIEDTILINSENKFLIKPQSWPTKNEPLSEQILMFDTEVHAVNIEHARNIAYNHTANVNAYLSVLLDCGFDMVKSEFRIFNIKDGNGVLRSFRFRTGIVDEELGLLVKDNHYGIKDLYDEEQVDSTNAGFISLSFAGPKKDGGLDFYSTSVLENSSNSAFLEEKFREHAIKSPLGSKDRISSPPLSDELNFLTNQMKLPKETRKFFKELILLDSKKKESFLACCRLYNLALTMAGYHPTVAQSYKVCAIEALGICENLKFSEVMVKYCNNDFDKELTDYFYSVRSKHFHAGKFLFDEYEIEFQRDVAFSFNTKNSDFINFSKYIRIVIVSWIKVNLLNKG